MQMDRRWWGGCAGSRRWRMSRLLRAPPGPRRRRARWSPPTDVMDTFGSPLTWPSSPTRLPRIYVEEGRLPLMSAPLSMPDAVAPFQLAPASRYSIEQLTAAYNQTRVDYLVPMPMNAARLADYIRTYDVDLAHSFVAAAGQMLGLGLLGVRPDCTWITRLGVLPVQRRHGVGRAIVEALLEASETVGGERTVLEVIKNNVPAYNLFWDSGFREARELLVLRRPPGPPAVAPVGEARWLDRAEALALAEQRPGPRPGIHHAPSLGP